LIDRPGWAGYIKRCIRLLIKIHLFKKNVKSTSWEENVVYHPNFIKSKRCK